MGYLMANKMGQDNKLYKDVDKSTYKERSFITCFSVLRDMDVFLYMKHSSIDGWPFHLYSSKI